MEPGPDPIRVLRSLQTRSADVRERAEALQAELAKISESVTSADRTVTVTVGAGGIMRGLVVEPGGERVRPTQWASAVLKAYQQGCRIVGERAAELMQRHAPGSPAVQMMRDAVPPDPDEEAAATK
ncbi:MAG: YbaB/EbfC family nucleoid-associated protein [Pseudonocardiales bacterium]